MLKRPVLMGILNVTPDSFSDGGQFYNKKKLDVDLAVKRAEQMMNEGADIIDIGGESSGPGSKDVPLEEELERIIPVIKKLKICGKGLSRPVLISVDTYKAEVARQAIEAGADMVNDVTALRGDPDASGGSKMAAVLAQYGRKSDGGGFFRAGVPVVIMYSKDPTARTTRNNVEYKDVIATVKSFLEERIAVGVAAGIARERFIIDPGMGAFVSMDPKYSLEILRRLPELEQVRGLKSLPILIGASRKGFIGQILGEIEGGSPLPVDQRLEGSLACAAIAVYNGASILRVHDVKETRKVVDMVSKIMNY